MFPIYEPAASMLRANVFLGYDPMVEFLSPRTTTWQPPQESVGLQRPRAVQCLRRLAGGRESPIHS